MEIKKPAVAGTLESSDCMVTVEPGQGQLDLDLDSAVIRQYGKQIRKIIYETLDRLEAGTLKAVRQDESRMTYDPMLSREMGEADFNLPAARVKGLINGLNPWPCVSVPMGEGKLKLLRAKVAEGSGYPGEVLTADPKGGLVIACEEDAVRILELQAPGGKKMKAEDYLRGHGIDVGTRL